MQTRPPSKPKNRHNLHCSTVKIELRDSKTQNRWLWSGSTVGFDLVQRGEQLFQLLWMIFRNILQFLGVVGQVVQFVFALGFFVRQLFVWLCICPRKNFPIADSQCERVSFVGLLQQVIATFRVRFTQQGGQDIETILAGVCWHVLANH